MEHNEIKLILINMISRLFPNSEIDNDVLEYVDLIEDLNMDSITFISMVVELETAFNIIIPDNLLLMDNFRCIDVIIDLVKKARENNNTSV